MTRRVRIQIVRNRRKLVDERVARICRYPCSTWPSWGSRPLFLRDLDGDGDPEVVAQFDVGGAHCCLVSVVYSYDQGAARYRRLIHVWPGQGADYRLRDANDDGRTEFVSEADFDCIFTACATTANPIQIWSLRRGRLVDVTRRFPRLIRPQARRYGRACRDSRVRRAWREPACAAWVADKASLGEFREAWRFLASEFRGARIPGRDVDYLYELRRVLREHGYMA